MMAKTHIAVGEAAVMSGYCVAHAFGFEPSVSLVVTGAVCGVVGALLPDIDSARSKARQTFNKVLLIITAVYLLAAVGYAIFGLGNKLSLVQLISSHVSLGLFALFVWCLASTRTSHRTFTHSVVGLLSATIIIQVLFSNLVITGSFAIAYLSHIVIDLLNDKGEHLLYPLPGSYCLHLTKANSKFSKGLGYAAYAVALLCVGTLFRF